MLTEEPSDDAYTTDIAIEALTVLAELGIPVRVTGEVYQPIEVTLNEAGSEPPAAGPTTDRVRGRSVAA